MADANDDTTNDETTSETPDTTADSGAPAGDAGSADAGATDVNSGEQSAEDGSQEDQVVADDAGDVVDNSSDDDESDTIISDDDDDDPGVSAHADEDAAVEQNDIDAIMGFSDDDLEDSDDDDTDLNDPYQILTRSKVLAHEHLPMIDVIFEQLTRNLSDSLRSVTSEVADVEYDGSQNITFGEYKKQVTLPALLAVIDLVEWEEQALVHVDAKLVYSIVDVMLGGQKAPLAKPEGRQYTSIEKAFVQDFLNKILDELSRAFEPVEKITFQLARFEDDPAFASIARDTNAAIWSTVNIELSNRMGGLNFVVPYGALEPARERLSTITRIGSGGSARIWQSHFINQVEKSHGTVSVEIDRSNLPLSEVANWREGCLLELDTKITDPVAVRLNGKHILNGLIDTKDRHYAVRLIDDVSTDDVEDASQ